MSVSRHSERELKKKKILFIVSSDLFVRNYLGTDALDLLVSQFDLTITASSSVTTIDSLGRWPVYDTFEYPKSIERRHYRLMDLLGWRYRKRSSTFSYRFWRLFLDVRLQRDWLWPLRVAHRGAQLVHAILQRIWPVTIWTIDHEMASLPLGGDLDRIIGELSPDLVMFPSTAVDPAGTDAIRIARNKGIPSLCLVDNWDNLSSKTVMWALPDYACVWGPQTKEHAITIQGLAADRVFTIGTPRFESYFTLNDQTAKPSSPYPFRFILFCGCSIPFDEVTSLRLLEDEMQENQHIYGQAKIVYRPHPWRQPRLVPDTFDENEFKHVILDSQLRSAYKCRQFSTNNQPSVDYYPRLLVNSFFVVGPLTTMLIEALICHREVLAIAYDDKIHKSSPHNALKYYRHFRGIERLSQLDLARTPSEFTLKFRLQFLRASQKCGETLFNDPMLDHFITRAPGTYASRLKCVVDSII